MIYCINPECKQRQNPDNLDCCQACGTPLLIQKRYRLIKPLRKLNPHTYTDIFEVDDGGIRKVMKVLKGNNPEFIKAFAQEANTLQWLKHPGIPKVDLDGYFTVTPSNSDEKVYCLVLEKISGSNLEEWVKINGKISQRQALNWLKQLIKILDYVHENSFFHRDIKPSNIMLKPNGQLVLIDFGSVREISDTYLVKIRGGLEVTSVISGGYTAPEQIEGKAKPQSDFYALGRTFVYLLTGESPVNLPNNPKTGQLIWHDQAPHISKPLADFIDELMSQLPRDRPQNTAVILPYLTRKGLWIKSIQRLVSSPKFKIIAIGLISLSITGGIIYRASFPLIAQHYYEEGVKYLKSEELDRALSYYKQALKFNENDARIYNDMGLICQRKKDVACAKINYDRAIKLNPNNSVARYNLAGFYDDAGDFKQAEIQYQRAIESGSTVAVNAISDLARLQILQGDTTAAIKLSLEGLQQTDKPKVKSALYKNLGWAHWMENNYQEAEVDLRQAIKLNSERTDAYCLLAQVLEARGNTTEALGEWQNCLNGDSKNRLEVKIWQTMARQRLKSKGAN